MVRIVQGIKKPGDDPEMEEKFSEVLFGGKGSKKRHYAVDEKLYGTVEGINQRDQADEKRKMRGKKKKRPKHKNEKEEAKEEQNAEKMKNSVEVGKVSLEENKNSVIALFAIGTLAAGVGILFGGKRS